MKLIGFLLVCLFVGLLACNQPESADSAKTKIVPDKENLQAALHFTNSGKGPLLLSDFTSFAELKDVIDITYFDEATGSTVARNQKPEVHLTYRTYNQVVTSILKDGISQHDFARAKNGNFLDKALLGIRSPFSFQNRKELASVENLGRRRPWVFGKGDMAFYDLAETMVKHISTEDLLCMSDKDLSEKGYLNTFNHITAQAFMTSIFSETIADFIADVHELYNMPELVTGNFTDEQISNIENGPVDNYVDMINNEFGQELGRMLSKKYSITRKTYWTPELLANYLNDIQSYQSWVFQIGFAPFRASDEMVIQFANKINTVKGDF